VLGLALSCSAGPSSRELSARASDWCGTYRQPWGRVHLTLEPGRYEASVVTGMTEDGCTMFVGAGSSRGTWQIEGHRARFVPETDDSQLAFGFAGCLAERRAGGLELLQGAQRVFLERFDDTTRDAILAREEAELERLNATRSAGR